MCIYDALTTVILSVKELQEKKRPLSVLFFFFCLNCEDDQEFVHLFPCVLFFLGMAPGLFFLENGVIRLRNSVQ